MKRKNLFKTLIAFVVVYMLLTWFIPTSSFADGKYVEYDIVPFGLFDLIRYPISAFVTSKFLLIGSVVVLVGVLYNVLNKTGAYQVFVDKIVAKYKDSKLLFLIITTLIFLTLSSLTGLDLVLFVMVPFFATVIMLLGYGKFTAMLSTIGAIMAGNLASTYGRADFVSYYTSNANDAIWYRVALFIIVLGILLLTVIKSAKETKRIDSSEIMFYEKTKVKSKKSFVPMIVIVSIFLVITIIGMIKWSEIFGINIFSEGYQNLKNFKIGDYPIGTNLLGHDMANYGSWTNSELSVMLCLMIGVISIVYKIKFNDLVQAVKQGVKKMLPIVFYILLANIILLALIAAKDEHTIFTTIIHSLFNLADGFNGIIYGIVVFVGSFFYNSYDSLLAILYEPTLSMYTSDLSIISFMAQGIYGLVQFFIPTSILLIIGLNYFDVSYTTWIKKMFNYILTVLIALIIILIIMTLI